jgi:hypothetical protein
VVVFKNRIFILTYLIKGIAMKSIKKIGAAIMLFSACSFAAPSLYVGGGGNQSSTTATDSLSAAKSPYLGFNIALGFEQNLSKHFSLISGISVETRGEKTESTTNLGSDSQLICKFHYWSNTTFPLAREKSICLPARNLE